MTDEPPSKGTRTEERFRHAEWLFAEIKAALEDGLEHLPQGDDRSLRAFETSKQLLWKSLLAVQEREKDLEKLRRESAGIVEGYALDLAAARTEIGGRLARLKAAAGGGELS